MAAPQIDNGYLMLANEIVEHLCHYRISGEEYQVIWAVWRKTWAWHKLDERISLKEFAKLTEMKKPSIIRAIKKLIDKRIISVSKKANVIAPTYRFNKNYDTWKTLAKKLTYKFVSNKANDVSKKANFAPQKPTTDKGKRAPKETIKRKKSNIYSKEYILSEILLSKILERRANFKKPNLQSWAVHIEKMIRIDNRDSDEIEKVINWCQGNSFWKNNILSTNKLRIKYDQLSLRMEETEPEDGVQTWYKQKLKEKESANGLTTLHN